MLEREREAGSWRNPEREEREARGGGGGGGGGGHRHRDLSLCASGGGIRGSSGPSFGQLPHSLGRRELLGRLAGVRRPLAGLLPPRLGVEVRCRWGRLAVNPVRREESGRGKQTETRETRKR